MNQILVVLDVDGTLIDSMALEAIVYPAAMGEHLGVQRISSDWNSYEGTTDPAVTDEIYIRHLGRRPTVSELNTFLDLYVSRLASSISSDPKICIAVPGAIEFLKEISRSLVYRAVVATGAWRRPIELKLRAAGIDLSGLPFVCADEWPDRNSIISAATRLLGHFDRTVLVGDAPWDVTAARDLGLGFVGVGQGEPAEVLKGIGATHVVADFSDITTVFNAINQAGIPGAKS